MVRELTAVDKAEACAVSLHLDASRGAELPETLWLRHEGPAVLAQLFWEVILGTLLRMRLQQREALREALETPASDAS